MFSYVLLVHVRKRRIFEEAVLVDELFEFLSVIALIVFKKKLEALGAAKCKAVYQLTLTFAVYAATAIWIRLGGHTIALVEWLKEGTVAYAASQVMYPVYENYHLRDFVEMGVELLKKKFISKEGK